MGRIISIGFALLYLTVGAMVARGVHAKEGFAFAVPERDPGRDRTSNGDAEFTPNIFVEQQTGCMDSATIKSTLGAVLRNREESRYIIISVVISPTVDGALAFLRAIDRETGEILLERTLRILPEECTTAHLALKVMVEQFLTSFPILEWKEKQAASTTKKPIVRTEKIFVEKETAALNWSILFGIDSRWPSPSGDAEIALGLDAGAKRHGLIGRLIFRGGFPSRLGEGRYFELWALAALGFRFSPKEKISLNSELRTGALSVNGVGYEKNYRQWLAMAELQLSILWKTGAILMGPEVAVSPLFYEVYTDTGERAELPWIRLGIVFCIPVGKTVLK